MVTATVIDSTESTESTGTLTTYVIPSLGMSGYFKLKTPFNSSLVENERYTCRAVRGIGDYLANNEDIYTNIYKANGLTETEFNSDCASGMYIVSLQSTKGQWIYLPASYILSFPITNGVEYHNLMIGISLGAVPTTKDISAVKTNLRNVIYDQLGIEPEIKEVQISKAVLIPQEQHETIETIRTSRITQQMSASSKVTKLESDLDTALEKIKILEAAIIENR